MCAQAFRQQEGMRQETRENIFVQPRGAQEQQSKTDVQTFKQGDPRLVGLSLSLQGMIDKEKLPMFSRIPWGEVKEIRVSRSDSAYSAMFSLNGKAQMVTIRAAPDSTQFILSAKDGRPFIEATQKGSEITITDFSAKKLSRMGRISRA